MQLFSFYVLPLLISSIHARAVTIDNYFNEDPTETRIDSWTTFTDPVDPVDPRYASYDPKTVTNPKTVTDPVDPLDLTDPTDSTFWTPSTDSTESEKCIISIEVGDCDTYQTCTKNVKITGNCSPAKEKGLKPIHCSFDVPQGMAGEKDLQDVSGIRCFPNPRPHGDHRSPNGTNIHPEEHRPTSYTGVQQNRPVPPISTPTNTDNKCVNAPLPKFPERKCKLGDPKCRYDNWFNVSPACRTGSKNTGTCEVIAQSECEAAPDRCDPFIWPGTHDPGLAHDDKCTPEKWYYVPTNCETCHPIPISQCDRDPELCGVVID